MMVRLDNFLQLAYVQQPRKIIKMEHGFIFAVLAKKGHVLAQIHVLKVISNKAAVAPLNTLAEGVNYLRVFFDLHFQEILPQPFSQARLQISPHYVFNIEKMLSLTLHVHHLHHHAHSHPRMI